MWLNNFISKEFTWENNWNLSQGNNLSSGNSWKLGKNVHHSIAYNTKILNYEYQSIGMAKTTYTLSMIDLWCRPMCIDIERYSLYSIIFKKQWPNNIHIVMSVFATHTHTHTQVLQ